MVNIEGLAKAAVLAALYNGSRPQGMGFLHFRKGHLMDVAEAEEILTHGTAFDYLYGRVLKISLADDLSFDEWGYDRDNGTGAAQRIVDALREEGNPATTVGATLHKAGVGEAADAALTSMATPSTMVREDDGTSTFTLTMADMADVVAPAVMDALVDVTPAVPDTPPDTFSTDAFGGGDSGGGGGGDSF